MKFCSADLSIKIPPAANIKWIVWRGPTVGSVMMRSPVEHLVAIKNAVVTITASLKIILSKASIFLGGGQSVPAMNILNFPPLNPNQGQNHWMSW